MYVCICTYIYTYIFLHLRCYLDLGIIKEVAPVANAETDELLGVDAFHQKYFLNNPLYIDIERKFYSVLGKFIHINIHIHIYICIYTYRSIQIYI
jgi:hypothetical protein